MEMTNGQRNRLIKKELTKKYGSDNVSVVGGMGAAYGWAEVHIYTEKPETCYCKETESYCLECCKEINKKREEASKLIYAIPNIEFYTYNSDDAYNTESDCLSIQVSINN